MGIFQLRVLSFGLVFLMTMLSVSYKLYHLNNFKILLSFLGVAALFIVFDLVPLFLKGFKKNKETVLVNEEVFSFPSDFLLLNASFSLFARSFYFW